MNFFKENKRRIFTHISLILKKKKNRNGIEMEEKKKRTI